MEPLKAAKPGYVAQRIRNIETPPVQLNTRAYTNREGKRVSFSCLNLDSVPECIFESHGIEELDLSFNHLISIPGRILQLRRLSILDVSRNDLTTLPEEIFSLTQLKKLDVSYNHLKEIPPYIKLLKTTDWDLTNNAMIDVYREAGITKFDLTKRALKRRAALAHVSVGQILAESMEIIQRTSEDNKITRISMETISTQPTGNVREEAHCSKDFDSELTKIIHEELSKMNETYARKPGFGSSIKTVVTSSGTPYKMLIIDRDTPSPPVSVENGVLTTTTYSDQPMDTAEQHKSSEETAPLTLHCYENISYTDEENDPVN